MWNLKRKEMIQMNLYTEFSTEQKQTYSFYVCKPTDIENKLQLPKGKGGEG